LSWASEQVEYLLLTCDNEVDGAIVGRALRADTAQYGVTLKDSYTRFQEASKAINETALTPGMVVAEDPGALQIESSQSSEAHARAGNHPHGHRRRRHSGVSACRAPGTGGRRHGATTDRSPIKEKASRVRGSSRAT